MLPQSSGFFLYPAYRIPIKYSILIFSQTQWKTRSKKSALNWFSARILYLVLPFFLNLRILAVTAIFGQLRTAECVLYF